MFLGIDRPEWFLLWSGILGAVVSAAVAALVATVVLALSNRHQIKLSEEAAEEQRKIVLMQLDEQRSEAARSREQTALAEVLIAVEGLTMEMRSTEDVRAYVPTLNAAMARWRIELGGGAMEREVMRWPMLLRRLALKVVFGKESGAGWADEFARLGSAIEQLSSVVLAWQTADRERRAELHDKLRVFRRETLDSGARSSKS